MLRLASYDIVFQEVPGEVTLALNLSCCPNRCAGCHSPHLRESTGEPLEDGLLTHLLEQYGWSVTCVCFMGGDGDPGEVERLAGRIRGESGLKIGWYSGKPALPDGFDIGNFDFIKLGAYMPDLGGLDSPGTNQRFFRVENGVMTDMTEAFRKNEK